MRIGIDVGGTFIKAGALEGGDGDFKVAFRRESFYPKGANAEGLARALAEISQKIARASGDDYPESLGIALPGVLNAGRDTLVSACNLKLFDAEIKKELQKILKKTKLTLINDADAAAVAEKAGGAFKAKQNALLLTLGTGVGSGMILNGKLFYDGNGQGAEIGHTPIFLNGEKCACGRIGCIQTRCSASWLAGQGRLALKDKGGMLFRAANGDPQRVGAKTVIDCARSGDKAATEVFEGFLESLGHAICCCFAFIDFETVALGGGVSLAGDFLFEPLIKRVEQGLGKKREIVPAFFKNNAGIIGAAIAEDYA